MARKPKDLRLEVGQFHGATIEPGDWRVVARSASSSVRPPGRRLPWGPSAQAVARRVSDDVGPIVRGYIGIVLYRGSAAEAKAAAAALRRSLDPRLKAPADIRIERWNPDLEAWQPSELWQTADKREVQVMGMVRCESKDVADSLTASLRERGQLFVRRQGRSVLVGTSGEAQANALLAPYGAVKVTPIKGRTGKHVVDSLIYDRSSGREKGGWLAYDPSGY